MEEGGGGDGAGRRRPLRRPRPHNNTPYCTAGHGLGWLTRGAYRPLLHGVRTVSEVHWLPGSNPHTIRAFNMPHGGHWPSSVFRFMVFPPSVYHPNSLIHDGDRCGHTSISINDVWW